jgi:UDP-N-acetylmuramoylalanine--D-glutamate ligase
MELVHKNILVLGAGISGIAVAKIAKRLGASVTLSDTQSADKLGAIPITLAEHGIRLVTGDQTNALLEQIHMVIPSPGISIYHPLLQEAASRGIEIANEVELAFRLTQAPFIAITGTNGKTTTTTLTGEILKNAGRKVVVGGNIGIPLSEEVYNLAKDALVVAEISSFQLEAVHEFRPHACAILNLTPDHLDRHGTVEVYQEMKERIFAKQGPKDYVILNYDDPVVRDMAKRVQSQVLFFSNTQTLPSGAFVKEGQLVLVIDGTEERICAIEEMGIRGGHNVQNALAACALAKVCGVSASVMADTLRNFKGVEHRLEFVAEIDGVKYYNDSKATNPESSIVALEAFSEPVVLIAGGRDKGTDLHVFMEKIQKHVRELILIGEAADRFEHAAKQVNIGSIHHADTFRDAVNMAAVLARPGESVLLSPACASYDMFKNYEERGKDFKELVIALRR